MEMKLPFSIIIQLADAFSLDFRFGAPGCLILKAVLLSVQMNSVLLPI